MKKITMTVNVSVVKQFPMHTKKSRQLRVGKYNCPQTCVGDLLPTTRVMAPVYAYSGFDMCI